MSIHLFLRGLTSIPRRIAEFVEEMIFAIIALCMRIAELFESED